MELPDNAEWKLQFFAGLTPVLENCTDIKRSKKDEEEQTYAYSYPCDILLLNTIIFQLIGNMDDRDYNTELFL